MVLKPWGLPAAHRPELVNHRPRAPPHQSTPLRTPPGPAHWCGGAERQIPAGAGGAISYPWWFGGGGWRGEEDARPLGWVFARRSCLERVRTTSVRGRAGLGGNRAKGRIQRRRMGQKLSSQPPRKSRGSAESPVGAPGLCSLRSDAAAPSAAPSDKPETFIGAFRSRVTARPQRELRPLCQPTGERLGFKPGGLGQRSKFSGSRCMPEAAKFSTSHGPSVPSTRWLRRRPAAENLTDLLRKVCHDGQLPRGTGKPGCHPCPSGNLPDWPHKKRSAISRGCFKGWYFSPRPQRVAPSFSRSPNTFQPSPNAPSVAAALMPATAPEAPETLELVLVGCVCGG